MKQPSIFNSHKNTKKSKIPLVVSVHQRLVIINCFFSLVNYEKNPLWTHTEQHVFGYWYVWNRSMCKLHVYCIWPTFHGIISRIISREPREDWNGAHGMGSRAPTQIQIVLLLVNYPINGWLLAVLFIIVNHSTTTPTYTLIVCSVWASHLLEWVCKGKC